MNKSPPPLPPHLKEIVVTNFEDGGIVYCADTQGIVYNTEDVYFDVRPARVIGRCVEGKFVSTNTGDPNPSASISALNDSTASDNTNPSDGVAATASE